MFSKLRAALPANRIAAIIAVLIGVGTIVTTFVADSGLAGTKTGDAIVAGVGLLGSLVLILKTIDKFLEGAQNWDSLMVAGVPKGGTPDAVANAVVSDDAGVAGVAPVDPSGDLSDAGLGATDGDLSEPVRPGLIADVPESDDPENV